MKKTHKIIIAILVVIVLLLLARFVVFKQQFDNWGEGLQRIGTWESNYKQEHPNATKEEMDAAFNSGMAGLKVWKENYMQEHPRATDAEADAAFNAAWKK